MTHKTTAKELLKKSKEMLYEADEDIIMMAIRWHFDGRKRMWPTVEDGLLWTMTELAEVFEIWSARKDYIRNNPEGKEEYTKERFAEELGDVIYMAMITGLAEGVNPLEAMFDKMKEQIERELEEDNDK